MLVGREPELAVLSRVVEDAIDHRGGALVLHGDPGVGKSTLLVQATAAARTRGLLVLGTIGHQAEVTIPYAGLHSLLASTRETASRPETRRIVLAAVGRGGQDDGPQRIAHAALEVITAGPDHRAVLIAIDDAHWLDRPSWDALMYVIKRVRADPVVVVLAMRDGPEAAERLNGTDLEILRVPPLPAAAAARLLDDRSPQLPANLRERVLAQAQGNPLALIEFAGAAVRAGADGLLPESLPLSTRVEQTFAALVAKLPPSTIAVLRVAAFDDRDDLAEILAAASVATGQDVGEPDVRPAIDAGLVGGDTQRLRFRHPLLRSALRQSASPAERIAAHAAIATVVAGDRRTWHRAQAATAPDADLARELARIADAAAARGDNTSAVAALRRAAELSEDPADRAGRLLSAASRLVDLAGSDAAARLLEQVDEAHLRGPERARLVWLREEHAGGGWSGATRMAAFARAIDGVRAEGNHGLALEALESVSVRVFWSNPDRQTRQAVLAVADRLEVPPTEPRLLSLVARVAPLERGAAVLDRLPHPGAHDGMTPVDQHRLGLAAIALGAFDIAAAWLAPAVDGLRRQGNLGTVAQALMSQTWALAQLAQTRQGLIAAVECCALAHETGQRMLAVAAHVARGQLEALRGNTAVANSLADEGERVLLPIGAGPPLAMVQLVRGIDALAGGRPSDAVDALDRVFDPSQTPFHPYVRLHALGLFAEACIHSGRHDRLAAVIAELAPIADASRCPALERALAYARAVIATTAEAERLFAQALAAPLTGWPFERARLQLAYGAWLRRHRRPAASREYLRAASLTFERLGVVPWAEQARRELAASGESLGPRVDRRDGLTPQELQIAQLAAQGLSNREIAERLFVSPRTVSTHLYRIYPKVGVSSRTELAQALSQSTDTPKPG